MTFTGFAGWLVWVRDRLLCVFLRHPSWTTHESVPLTPEEVKAFEASGFTRFELAKASEIVAVCDRCGMISRQADN